MCTIARSRGKYSTKYSAALARRPVAVSRPRRMLYACRPMNALDALLNRASVSQLREPAPSPAQLDIICRAALRAADHARLRPWRFLLVRGESRERLGGLFGQAALDSNPRLPELERERARRKALRAPLIIVVIASHVEHPKVPAFDQDLSAGAGAQNMLIAAHAQGVGAIWRTGPMAEHPVVMKGMGLAEHEKIIGFIYLGTAAGNLKTPPELDPVDFFREW